MAVLYWPKIVRLVPKDYPTYDSDTVRLLVDELDFVERVPAGKSVETASSRFDELIARHGDALRTKFGITIARDELGMRSRWNVSISASKKIVNVENLGIVHLDEITEATRMNLIESGLALLAEPTFHPYGFKGAESRRMYEPLIYQRNPRDRKTSVSAQREDSNSPAWLFVDERLAEIYSTLIAEDFSAANDLQLTTDQKHLYRIANNWSPDEISALLLGSDRETLDVENGNFTETIALLALDLVIPSQLANVPISKIIEIRRRHGEEFLAFGAEIDQVVTELRTLPDIRDQAILESYLNDVVAVRFEQPLEELQRQLKGLGIDAATTAINVKTQVPAGAALVAGGLMAGHPLIAGCSAAMLGLLTVRREYRRQRDALLQSKASASFLIHVRKELQTRDLLAKTMRSLGRGAES